MIKHLSVLSSFILIVSCGPDVSDTAQDTTVYNSPFEELDGLEDSYGNIAPELKVSPSALLFSKQDNQRVEISNVGNVDLLEMDIEAAGDIDISPFGGCVNQSALEVGKTCTFMVKANREFDGTGELRIEGLDYQKIIPVTVPLVPIATPNTPTEPQYDPDILRLLTTHPDSETEDVYRPSVSVSHPTKMPDIGLSKGPFEAERVLPANTWISFSLDSELRMVRGGSFKGVVDYPVYSSSRTTPELLIPQGSIVTGTYSASQGGLPELLIQTISTTNRVLLDVGQLEGGDAMGRIGVPAKVDWQALRRYGPSVIVSATTAAAEALLGEDTSNAVTDGTVVEETSARAEAIKRFGDDMQKIGERLLEERSQIPVLSSIPKATVINIMTSQPIYFPTEEEQLAFALVEDQQQTSNTTPQNTGQQTPTITNSIGRLLERQQ